MSIETPRNSGLRQRFGPYADKAAQFLIDTIPGITANKITVIGAGLVGLGSLIAALPKDWLLKAWNSPLALYLMANGILLDALDGTVARRLGTSSDAGALLDLKSDRIQESTMALSRIASAAARKDAFGVLAAAYSGITSSWPSLARAEVESLGYEVEETGKNIISLLGTRPMRAIFGTITTSYPVVPVTDMAIQPAVDTISTISNVVTTMERISKLHEARSGSLEKTLSVEYQRIGKEKRDFLLKFSAVNLLILGNAGVLGFLSTLS